MISLFLAKESGKLHTHARAGLEGHGTREERGNVASLPVQSCLQAPVVQTVY